LLEKVRVVLNDIKEEGLENVFKRHNRLARATRAAIEAMGLTMVVPDSPADSATGCFVPEGLDGGKLVKSLRDDFGVTLAGGQDQGKAKLFASHIWVMWIPLISSLLFQH
jgi:aspartate aminotransferase-like enzyme